MTESINVQWPTIAEHACHVEPLVKPRVAGALPSVATMGQSALQQAPCSPALPHAPIFISGFLLRLSAATIATVVAAAPLSSPALTAAPFSNRLRT